MQPIVEQLRSPGARAPAPRTGPLDDPFFLGLVPTRGCNLGCRYCDFAAPKQSSPVMDLSLAGEALDAYFGLLHGSGGRRAEVHFFGGEPFYAEAVVHFAVEYASLRAVNSMAVRFEATTNGVYSAARCHWIADHFDTIVLSLDGPAEVQDRQRPALDGRSAFAIVARNAKILSEGPVELILRACVTNETVARLPEIARWVGREFRPSTVCFETLTDTPRSRAAGAPRRSVGVRA
jgi:sulfatase maturation enzyme AslB (radical SAM superfamily)